MLNKLQKKCGGINHQFCLYFTVVHCNYEYYDQIKNNKYIVITHHYNNLRRVLCKTGSTAFHCFVFV